MNAVLGLAPTTLRDMELHGTQPLRVVLPGGTHRVLWDRRDSRGREVAAGIYFVRLQWLQRVDTGKLVLVR